MWSLSIALAFVPEAREPFVAALPEVELPAPIVGGAPAPEAAWPELVAVFTINDTFGCTGTLIAPDLVLTAGHCGLGMAFVVAGAQDLSDGGTRVDIAESFVHPDYYATYDVAVYRLVEPVPGVVPAPLLRDCLAARYLVDGADAVIVGWGDIDTYASVSTEVLHEAVVSVEDADCDDLSRACNPSVSPGGELIAGGDGVDSCNGDSGGPLFLPTDLGVYLAGVTSRAALPSTVPCGDGGIYARADQVVDWIEQATGTALPRPDCEGINLPPVPSGAVLRVDRGRGVALPLIANDPNPDQGATWRIVSGPDLGRARVEGSALTYVAPLRDHGTTELVLEVTDDGEPPLSAQMTVTVTVSAPVSEVGGCATAPAGGWAALGLVGWALRRRGRRPPGPPPR